MSLCTLCCALTISNLYPPNVYHHGDSLAAVEQSGHSCQLCKLIHWSIARANEGETNPQLSFEGALDEVAPYGEHKECDQCSIKLQFIIEAQNDQFKRVSDKEIRHIGIWLRSRYMVSDVTLAVEEGDELGVRALIVNGSDSFIAGRVLASANPSDAYFDLAKRWFNECISNHSACESDAPNLPELPTRVVDVACDGQAPRLVDGAGKHARYATLSHCWGRSPTIKTELGSLRSRQTGIPLDTLPKTFLDAVVICRKIGILYLWIDSLCIVQDDKGDWEYHSSVMGSIFYNSTLTLAATDASSSSVGLFVPASANAEYPWLGIIALPCSFGDGRGRVYVTAPSWGIYRSPTSDVHTGILQSRGWVTQEKVLSLRSLHFMKGQMAWECSKCVVCQDGVAEEELQTQNDVRSHLKALQQAFGGSYILAEYYDDDDESDGEFSGTLEQSLNVEDIVEQRLNASGVHEVADVMPTLEAGSYRIKEVTAGHLSARGSLSEGRLSYHIDLRDPHHRDDSQPTLLNRQTSPALYNLLEQATRQTIYNFGYYLVSAYSSRRLTFPSDKLPALAGIASRMYAITRDDYLAGHWRRDLEKSLFWITQTESSSGHPGRVKEYRAPSWSWASVDGLTGWFFPDLAPGVDLPAPVEILAADVEVNGANPFGCIAYGNIVMRANTLRARWDPAESAWRLDGASTAYGETPTHVLTILASDNTVIGVWEYDDLINGILPGLPLTEYTAMEEVHRRSVPRGYFGSVHTSNVAVHGEDAENSSTLWKRGSYVPEELVLVKGPTKPLSAAEQEWYGRKQDVEVLVLTGPDGPNGEYKRVGVGKLGDWDDGVGSIEVLTVI